MRAYEILETHQYEGTLTAAHLEAKRMVKEGDFKDWRDLRIAEVEVETDKEGVLALLNERAIIKYTGKRWEFGGPRLGLVPSELEDADVVE